MTNSHSWLCLYIVLWAPLSHRIVIKTLSRHYFLLILSCWVELFFPRSSKNTSNFRLFPFLPAVTTDNYSPYLPFTLPLSQHCLTSISTLSRLSHFHLNTAHTDTLPQTLHIRYWFFLWLFHNGHHCACPSCTFDSWIQKNTNSSTLELLAWYIWRRTACATERMCQRTINICHMSFTPLATLQYILEQEIHGYLNPMSGKTDIETIVMTFA